MSKRLLLALSLLFLLFPVQIITTKSAVYACPLSDPRLLKSVYSSY